MKNAIITAVSGYVPEQKLTNFDLEKIMETSDEWITTRTGIKERRVMPEGQAVVQIGVNSVNDILAKKNVDPKTIDLVICATCTGDFLIPDCANSIAYATGMTNAFGFDLNAACSGFVYALYTASQFIKTGVYKKIIVVGAEKLTARMNYNDRTTSIIFGDGGGAVLLEPTDDLTMGIIDADLHGDGEGKDFLRIEAGGTMNVTTPEHIENGDIYVRQEGKKIFKRAVNGMSRTMKIVMERNGLAKDDIRWVVPHQANLRIINAVASQLDFPMERVMVNIEKYGNTSAGTIPLCLWDYEPQMQKGDGIMLTAFGGGFTWGSLFLRWAY